MGSNKYQNLSNKQKLKAFIPWLNHLVKNIHLKYHSCKKILSNRFTRYLLITSICLMLLVFWVMFVKMPRDKVKKSVEMTQVLSKTLGTRITAVRAKPNMNTTLLQPSTYHCNVWNNKCSKNNKNVTIEIKRARVVLQVFRI